MKVLLNHQWKGGVRELENIIERAIILSDNEYLSNKNFPAEITGQDIQQSDPTNLKDASREFEKVHIQRILAQNSNKQDIADLLGLSLSSLYRKIDELGLRKEANPAR